MFSFLCYIIELQAFRVTRVSRHNKLGACFMLLLLLTLPPGAAHATGSAVASPCTCFGPQASADGHAAVVERLLQAGAPVNAADNGGVTPLMLASHEGHLAVVHQLLDAGALANATNDGNDTALHIAAWRGKADVCAALIAAGAAIGAETTMASVP